MEKEEQKNNYEWYHYQGHTKLAVRNGTYNPVANIGTKCGTMYCNGRLEY
jgi:hypothetical protein